MAEPQVSVEQVDKKQDNETDEAKLVEFQCAKRFRIGRGRSLRTTDVGEVIAVEPDVARRLEAMNKGSADPKKAAALVDAEQERQSQIAGNIGRADGNPNNAKAAADAQAIVDEAKAEAAKIIEDAKAEAAKTTGAKK